MDSLMTIQHALSIHRPSVGSCELEPGLLILAIVFWGPQLPQLSAHRKAKAGYITGLQATLGCLNSLRELVCKAVFIYGG